MPNDAATTPKLPVAKRSRWFWFRIAVSTFFGLLTVATIAFWVRSYTYQDHAYIKLLPKFYVQGIAGDARMCVWFKLEHATSWFDWWSNEMTFHTTAASDNRMPPFDLAFWPTFARLYLAHWVLASTTATIAVAPWLRRRYGLRALLVMMTIVALMAGTIGWVDRTF